MWFKDVTNGGKDGDKLICLDGKTVELDGLTIFFRSQRPEEDEAVTFESEDRVLVRFKQLINKLDRYNQTC